MKQVRISVELLGSDLEPIYRDFYIEENQEEFSNISGAVADMLSTLLDESSFENTDKVSDYHRDHCSGCALCDVPPEPSHFETDEDYRLYRDQEVRELNSKL